MKWVIRILAGLVGLLLVGAMILLALGQRHDAGVVRGSVEIARSPEAVWPWLTDPAKLRTWVGWVVEIRNVSTNDEIWVMEDRNNGNARMEIHASTMALDPPRRIVEHLSVPQSFQGNQEYRLTNLGGGRTRLEVEGHWHYDQWLFSLMEPLVTPEARKKLVEDLERLKSLIESSKGAGL
jgi:uncharacterized protein YndB with AHSA1/START domain